MGFVEGEPALARRLVVGERDVLCYSRRGELEPNPPKRKTTGKVTGSETVKKVLDHGN